MKFELFLFSFYPLPRGQFNGTISLRSRIVLKRTYFQPAEYDVLRKFFSMILKKHNEQIVLEKKK